MKDLPKPVFSIALLALAACAPSPRLSVNASGHLPEAGTYQLAEEDSEKDLKRLVAEHLGQMGFEAVDRGQYLVQVAEFERSSAVGLFSPDVNDEDWYRSPSARGRLATRGVTITVTDTASGREIYRVTATQDGRARSEAEVPMDLVAAAFRPPAPSQRQRSSRAEGRD